MVKALLTKIFGTKNERELKRLSKIVEVINSLEPEVASLSDEQLRAKTDEFRERLQKLLDSGKEREEALRELMPEVFAVVREVAKRKVQMRPFDVQLMGAIVLHEGKIAEMKTGEGKTLVATMPLYLNALTGKNVHLVTVNDYLARRDATWMGPIYLSLGLSVGVIQGDGKSYRVELTEKGEAVLVPCTRKEAYLCDITYGTNSEFGFDYLRDNMAVHPEQIVQRGHFYAIVDEVDSILIDEARTPLIISGPSELSVEKYYLADRIVRQLKKGEDYDIDEKSKTAWLTEQGVKKVEKMLGVENLFAPQFIELQNAIIQALRAHSLFHKDVDYIVKDGKVLIVDEFTGRVLPGRRYSDGLHQALEAKERLRVQVENQTLASITYQNYFRMYEKLAGMTGTAATEAQEFWEIYGLDVVVIPTNAPVRRIDYDDVVYRTKAEKWEAVVKEIERMHAKGRPVLVGTTSIEDSEHLSSLLKRKGIPHQVLNAKHHEREAKIIAQAGQKGVVTIATNMAGRGTDIKLGPGVVKCEFCILKLDEALARAKTEEERQEILKKAEKTREFLKSQGMDPDGKDCIKDMPCGLHIIGTQRHEARRIDNQLRGRSGRQGDPGSSRFIISLEDDLMRLFGGERLKKWLDFFGHPKNKPISDKWTTKGIENAQKRVEEYHFNIRKRLLEYDDVMNRQRQVIYEERRRILFSDNLKEHLFDMVSDVIDILFERHFPDDVHPASWDLGAFSLEFRHIFSFEPDLTGLDPTEKDFREKLKERLLKKAKEFYDEKEKRLGSENLRQAEKFIMLQVVDQKWKEHLHAMDSLREGIGLRAWGQRDPLVEYKKEAFEMFGELVDSIKTDIVGFLFNLEGIAPAPPPRRREEISEFKPEKPKVRPPKVKTGLSKTQLKKKKHR